MDSLNLPNTLPPLRAIGRLAAIILAYGFLFGCGGASSAQNVVPSTPDAAALVRRAVQHRLDSNKNHRPLQYLIRRIDERRDTTKAIIETSEGNVARLVAIGAKPISAEADQAELNRLHTLSEHPELQQRRRKNEQKDADRVTHLLSLMPEAFKYRFEDMVHCPSGQCYRLTFTPDSSFTPPDLEANVLRGIAGEILIDQTQERLVRLDARFISDVDFGFGLLGRLNKGGTVRLEQSDIGSSDWELTALDVHVTGKALMVKSFTFQITEQASHFSHVEPGLDYRDAIHLLQRIDATRPTPTP